MEDAHAVDVVLLSSLLADSTRTPAPELMNTVVDRQ